MMLRQQVDALTAMGTSWALVWNNLPAMIVWGAIVLALFLLWLATGLLGLIVVFPLLGHATWHAYKAMRPCGAMTAANRLRPRSCCWRAAPSATACARPTCRCPAMHCGGCVARIERRWPRLPGVEQARVNLSSRRVVGHLAGDRAAAARRDARRRRLRGAPAERRRARRRTPSWRELVRALAVAGFAAMNIMALSVSVWSGADAETRDLFHWISAAIALPAWPIRAGSSSARRGRR